MNDETNRQRPQRTPAGARRFRLIAALVVVAAAAVILFLVLRDNGSSSSSTKTSARAVTAADLSTLATTLGHPIFWLGPKDGDTYELTHPSDGSIIVRYLPAGASVGANTPYTLRRDISVLRRVRGAADRREAVRLDVDQAREQRPRRRLAEGADQRPRRVPGRRLPDRGLRPDSRRRDLRGHGRPAGRDRQASPRPPRAQSSVADLKALAQKLGHPVYWAGPKAGVTYELTQAANGSIYIRYLPRGASVGSPQPYLTVATYPFPGAYAALVALTKQPGARSIKLDERDRASEHARTRRASTSPTRAPTTRSRSSTRRRPTGGSSSRPARSSQSADPGRPSVTDGMRHDDQITTPDGGLGRRRSLVARHTGRARRHVRSGLPRPASCSRRTSGSTATSASSASGRRGCSEVGPRHFYAERRLRRLPARLPLRPLADRASLDATPGYLLLKLPAIARRPRRSPGSPGRWRRASRRPRSGERCPVRPLVAAAPCSSTRP